MRDRLWIETVGNEVEKLVAGCDGVAAAGKLETGKDGRAGGELDGSRRELAKETQRFGIIR